MKPIANTFIIIMLMITICQVAWTQGATEDFKKGHDFFKNKKYIDAVEWFRKAAEQGDAVAQSYLAICYWEGYGVMKSDTEAMNWFLKSAEQGYVAAQYGIGKFYRDGKCGFTEDSKEAVKWFRKAAEQGLVEAQYDLAVCYGQWRWRDRKL